MIYKFYSPCNIYPSALIGDDTVIGAFSEIGPEVVIGNNVKIGAFAYIPKGVTIEDDCFIGPRVTFMNDKYPPSKGKEWRETIVKRGAVIGAAVTILPGVIIGEGAQISAGVLVTKGIPAKTRWYR